VLTNKYFDGVIPEAHELTDYDRQTIEEFKGVKEELSKALDTFHFRAALAEAMKLARIGNKYLADTEPWKLAKTDMERTATVLHLALQIAANLAIAFEPFLPFSSEKLAKMLQLDAKIGWEDLGRIDLLPEGQALGEVSLLFEKIEDAAIQAQLDRLERIKKENEAAAQAEALKNWRPEPIKEATTIDEFDKADIRVATVLECTNVKKSDRLLQFKLDDGMGGRTILSGIAQSYPDPSVLVGKQVLFIANFPPRKMMGIESQGMILSAVNADGKLVVTTVSAPVKNGSQVG
jgi:methionyl-tRNA synthetase